MILFGFPHCGDKIDSYMTWSDGLPARLRFQCVELTQAQLSMREVSTVRWEQALLEVCLYVKSQLKSSEDYGFMGHCWGGLLAFEVSHRLRSEGLPEPRHLFLSGCSAPHLLRPRGTASGELDSAIGYGCQSVESYHTPVNREPLCTRISVFTGRKDENAHADHLAEWSRYTSKICDVHVCEGDHYYWRSNINKWLQMAQTIVEREYFA